MAGKLCPDDMHHTVEFIRSIWKRRSLPITTFKTSTPTVQKAVVLTVLALLSFAVPFIGVFMFRVYPKAFVIFWLLYLILAILATVTSLLASKRGEWRHPFSDRRLLLSLYGLPIVLCILVSGWAMKR